MRLNSGEEVGDVEKKKGLGDGREIIGGGWI